MGGMMQWLRDKILPIGIWRVFAIILAGLVAFSADDFACRFLPEEWITHNTNTKILGWVQLIAYLVVCAVAVWLFVSSVWWVCKNAGQWAKEIRRRNGGSDRMGGVMQNPKENSGGGSSALAIILVALAVMGVFGLAPLWFPEKWGWGKIEMAIVERVKLAAYLVGGIILIWQVQISNRRATALEKTATLGEKGNITERFKNAIEHLANDKAESVQIGGIYTLYHVAREAEEYKDAALKVLLARLRKITERQEEPISEVVKAILDVLFVPIGQEPLFKEVDLSGVNLRGIKWTSVLGGIHRRLDTIVSAVGLDLSDAVFIEVDLSGAKLIGAILHGTKFQEANLSKCVLMGVETCENAYFSDATCIGTIFFGIHNFERARFTHANLMEADFDESGIGARQLLAAKTLYRAELPDDVRDSLMEERPYLFDKPKIIAPRTPA